MSNADLRIPARCGRPTLFNRTASAALAAACVLQVWRRAGDSAALAVGAGSLILLAMIWCSPLFAAVLRRRGSALLGSAESHAVEPVIFVVLGWGLLAFIAWVAFSGG
ncbi:MAG: hypothetical protein EBT83_10700 [Betaproteobacteria bacterium]|nr:hypothetical protein [Betaproteobacteria bacterium]